MASISSGVSMFWSPCLFLLAAVKEPPYQVSESGYAGFNMPIDIHFRNKEEPRKLTFHYDMFLHEEHFPPVSHIRCEKLTFQNPTEDFRRRLIKAGGVSTEIIVLNDVKK